MSDPMKNYEVTFIVDSVLSSEEIKATAQTYADLLRQKGCNIVHVDEMGLRQMAYPINRRNSGVYFCIEFETLTGDLITEFELALRRDERIMRFLTVKLDKYGVKYNADKRNGLIGKIKKKEKVERGDFNDRGSRPRYNAPSAPAAPAAPADHQA
jgi:small subunit ribosomal protein S6